MFGIIVLAIVQGIAEFLPISSSAHLIIFRDLFHIGNTMKENVALTFDIALHLGTLLAIVVYFFKDFWNMTWKGITKGPKDPSGKLFWHLVVATIPAAIFGVLLEETIEESVRGNYLLIAFALAFMGIVIYMVDQKSKQQKYLNDLTLKDAFLIGCAQVFALVPGFSRSGTTIAAGRALKLKREDAAKFSFYLSAPVVAGAVVLSLLKSETWVLIKDNFNYFMIGILVAFLSGLFCIEFLLKYIKKHDFRIFMWYRILLAIVIVLMVLL